MKATSCASRQANDKKILKKINDLIKDINRNGNEGLEKPKPLKHELSALWNRLIDSWDVENIYIYSCQGHY
jgi:toxin YoeB